MSTDNQSPSPDTLKDGIIKSITLPISRDEDTNELVYDIVPDAFILSCGCILSKNFALQLSSNSKLSCPICYSSSSLGYDLKPLQNLYYVLYPNEFEYNQKKESLLSLFYSVANSINDKTKTSPSKKSTTLVKHLNTKPTTSTTPSSTSSSINETIPITTSLKQFPTNSTNSITNSSSIIPSLPPPQEQSIISSSPSSSTIPHPKTESPQEQKEYLFVKCFPTYRRHFQYNTHSKFLKTKSKNFINTSISPSSKFFVLLSVKKYEVYSISSDSKTAPRLHCCGKSNGEFGLNFENLQKISNEELIIGGNNNNGTNNEVIKKKLNDWEHLYCSISDEYLVISGTNGIFKIIDLINQPGKPIYLYISNFPIRCIEISPNSQLIAYGITGKDRILGTEQALVVLHKLNNQEGGTNNSIFTNDPITITFPYRDPINNLSFSSDSNYLSCSTALESRFLTIWVKNYTEPKLVMKSIRSLDTSLESEGITDIQMFPNNQYMIITSASFNAAPIIIDNNISSINGLQTVAQPKMLLKLDEIGSSIHKSAISPRNDTVAVLDKNGSVYLIFATRMDQESKRIFIVDQVSNAFRKRESASLKFSKDGHKLYILDRKGIFYINDFAAGLPQNPEITRCKPLLWGD
ncbi:unnamed protein product [Wickerhamomyces anomalus]